MSYQEKRTIVSVLSGILVLAAYCIYAFSYGQSSLAGSDDLKLWATMILTFIGIGIAVSIVIQILFHIIFSISVAIKKQIDSGVVDDKEVGKTIELEMVEDEMDKMISLKSMRIGFIVAGLGFIVALVALVLNYSAVVMLNIIFITFSVGTIIEGFTQLYFYRKGVRNV